MKFSAAAIVAALAATTHGFSVSMSSIGYLNNLGGSAGVASSPPPASYSPFGKKPAPSPSPMAAPMAAPVAPAPAPASSYKSALADAPANSDLNYLKSIGGGSAMKSGRNYSGVGQSWKSAPSPSPMAAAPAPAAPAAAPASAVASGPSNSDLNYLKTLGGGNAMKSGRNYSGVSQSWKSAPSSSPMAAPVAAPAPAPVAAAASGPSNSDLNYLKTLGGGNAMKSGRNYSGVSQSWKSAPSSSPMSAPVAAPAPAPVAAVGSGPSNSDLNYLKTLGGGNAMKSGRNYSGVSQSWKSAPSPSPMAAPVAAPAPAPASTSSYQSGLANAPANSDLNYLKSIGGGGAMKSGKNYSGVSQSFRAVRPSIPSHTESLNGKTMAPPSYAAAPAPAPVAAVAPSSPAPAPANGNYLESMGGAPMSSSYSSMHKSMASATNYAGVNPRPQASRSAFGSYLEAL